MARNFVWSKKILVESRNFLKNSYLTQFSKFLSEFWHVISNFTYQQVINSNMGSNMAPLMVSREGPLMPPAMGATESDRSWEIGLICIVKIEYDMRVTVTKFLPGNHWLILYLCLRKQYPPRAKYVVRSWKLWCKKDKWSNLCKSK